MEVMGLMLGEFVDDYTVKCVDVFSMPQSGTGVSVEAVDPVYQTKMLDMLKQTGRAEMVVGWYHSHPGFGCWLSGVDMNTTQSFEQLNPRAVAVVVDPILSVKGKVRGGGGGGGGDEECVCGCVPVTCIVYVLSIWMGALSEQNGVLCFAVVKRAKAL